MGKRRKDTIGFAGVLFSILLVLGSPFPCSAAGGGVEQEAIHTGLMLTLLVFAGLVLGEKVREHRHSPVLAEIGIAIALRFACEALGLEGLKTFLLENRMLEIAANLGAVLLLFSIALEENVAGMRKVGIQSFNVAGIGVVLPFAGGFAFGYWLMAYSFATSIFLGAVLSATSVGITGRLFADLGFRDEPEGKIVLGAAVIDDVKALIILAVAVVVAQSTAAALTAGDIAWSIGKPLVSALVFLAGGIALGCWSAPRVSAFLARIHCSWKMALMIGLLYCFGYAAAAVAMGLAAIVGGFVGGLVLEHVHIHPYVEGEETVYKSMEDIMQPFAFFLGMIFFIRTGLEVDLFVIFGDPTVLLVGLALTAIAVGGKLASGLAVNGGMNKLIIGVGMVPRGEVGLILAVIGLELKALPPELFPVVVMIVAVTTFVPPLFLPMLIRRHIARKYGTGMAVAGD